MTAFEGTILSFLAAGIVGIAGAVSLLGWALCRYRDDEAERRAHADPWSDQ